MEERIRVFIVDDSTVFRSQIRTALEDQDGIEIVGFATDGRMACEALKHKKVDVVTLDLEMPVMSGLETLKELKRSGVLPYVLVFSSQTKRGAESTLAALHMGASDFLLKPQLEPHSNKTPAEAVRAVLLPKIYQVREKTRLSGERRLCETPSFKKFSTLNWASFNPEIVVIASSTGGPSALEKLFSLIRKPLCCPVLIVQHMPPLFTAALAERLQKISGLEVREGVHGEKLKKGQVYIAPGDFHMIVERRGEDTFLVLNQDPLRNSVRPAADNLFESAAKIFKNATLGIVMTGMGSDGKDGALAVKNLGGGIFIQDKESSVVFGMPGAVFNENAFDLMTSLEGIAHGLGELSVCAIERLG